MPRAVRPFSMPSAIGFEFPIVPVAQQRVVVRIRLQVNASAMPAIAARRPTARHKFLSPERHAAVSATPCLHQNFRFIYKHSSCFLLKNDNISIQRWRKSRNLWRSLIVSRIRVWLRRPAILLVILIMLIGIGAYFLYFHRDTLAAAPPHPRIVPTITPLK